jgi:membrane-bound lytic murein transglycosylase D
MPESIRPVRIALRSGFPTVLALLACACAHVPPATDAPPTSASGADAQQSADALPAGTPVSGDTPVTSRTQAVPPASAGGAYPVPAVPGEASPGLDDPGAQDALAAQTPAAAGLTASQYPDLFARIRAGFKVPDHAGRAVDQQANWYASNPEYLERAFGRAELYLYHIVSEIESRGMPLELALLPVVESAFEPYAYSRARASGLWQFIPGTGSHYGLKQNWWYDGRRDVVESTRAALDYLQYLHDEFNGDWLLAIASYNCGENRVAREFRKNLAEGKAVDFWSLRLPAETRAYVPKLLAMKRLVADPASFGLEFSPIANQPYFTRVETGGQIDLKIAAEIAGVSDLELYELNPAFHRWATDPAGPHYLLLPSDTAESFRTTLASLGPDERLRISRYTVLPGDTLTSIARNFETTPNVIRELNDFRTGVLHPGDELRVPSAAAPLPPKVARAAALVDGRDRRGTRPNIHVVRRGDSLWAIARRHGMSVNQLAVMNGMQPSDTLRAGQKLRLKKSSSASGKSGSAARGMTYTVRRGDTLSRIARVFQVTVTQLASWNGISVKTPIRPGQKLTVRVTRKG